MTTDGDGVRMDAGALPVPDEAARAQSQRVLAHVSAAISASEDGRIGFARYMDLVLHAPGLGYYSSGTTKFGAGGDFTTAAEFSRVYSICLAHHCASVLDAIGGSMLEIGAGSGRMARDMLETMAALGRPPDRYLILEPSADLRERQHRLLSESLSDVLMQRVSWLDCLPEAPFDGIVIANELLDAMPIHRVRRRDGRWLELCVGIEGDRLFLDDRPIVGRRLSAALREILEAVPPLPDGYIVEIGLTARDWIGAVAGILGRGKLLIVDYGYPRNEFYHPQRTMGTLVCYYRHRCHDDPLLLPGLQDITAHVEFTSIAEAGRAAGLECLGFSTQASFLLGAGLPDLVADDEIAGDPVLSRDLQTLLMPGAMGETFKVMALGRGCVAGPGFQWRDERYRL